LIPREIAHRRLTFALAVLAVLAAVGCLTATLALLEASDQRAERLMAERELETRGRLEKLQDDYRKITKNLGFNLLILPRHQSLSDLYADDFAAKTMPEEYAQRLAKAKVLTVNHVLPTLQQKIKWPEQANRTILLTGVRGE